MPEFWRSNIILLAHVEHLGIVIIELSLGMTMIIISTPGSLPFYKNLKSLTSPSFTFAGTWTTAYFGLNYMPCANWISLLLLSETRLTFFCGKTTTANWQPIGQARIHLKLVHFSAWFISWVVFQIQSKMERVSKIELVKKILSQRNI